MDNGVCIPAFRYCRSGMGRVLYGSERRGTVSIVDRHHSAPALRIVIRSRSLTEPRYTASLALDGSVQRLGHFAFVSAGIVFVVVAQNITVAVDLPA